MRTSILDPAEIGKRALEIRRETHDALARDVRFDRLRELVDAAGISEGSVVPDEILLAAGFTQAEINEHRRAASMYDYEGC